MSQIQESEILFLLNPSSGKKNALKIGKKIRKAVPSAAILTSRSVEDSLNIMEQYAHCTKAYVVVGGDGTVSSTIPFFLRHPEKLLAIYPNGSGNGFAREMKFTKRVEVLLQSIKTGDFITIDILKINDHFCANIAGVGIDSNVAHAFKGVHNRGIIAYTRLAITSFLNFTPIPIKLFIDNKLVAEDEYMMCTVANTRQFGYNAYIAPMAKPNDGRIEIVLFKKISFRYYFRLAFQMFSGTLEKSKLLRYISTSSDVKIQSPFNIVNIDGEPQEINDDIDISILNDTLRVVKMPGCKW